MSKEEWKQELDVLRRHYKEVLDESQEKDERIKALDKQLGEFLRQNRQVLTSRAHDLTSTTETLRVSSNDDDVITKFKERLAYLLGRMRRVINERELLQHDRDKCFTLMELNGEALLLHEAIALRLVDMPKSIQTYQEELAGKDQTVKRVRRLLQEYEAEAENKEKRIARLKSDLVDKDKQVVLLGQRVRQLEREKEDMEMVARAQAAYSARKNSDLGGRSVKRSARKSGKERHSIS